MSIGAWSPAASAPAVSLQVADRRGMSLTHCPLCVGLAVLSVLRALGHGLMLAIWLRRTPAGAGAVAAAAGAPADWQAA